MEFISLEDIINNPDHPIMKEVRHHLDGKEGDILTCIHCGTEYKRGAWDFYSLCNPCFTEMDRIKMAKRWGSLRDALNNDSPPL